MRTTRVTGAGIPGKILLCFVGRNRGDLIVAAAKAAGGRGGTIALGRTINDSRILQALSLADVSQDIVFILMGKETGEVVAAVREAARNAPRKLSGRALLMDVPAMLTHAISAVADSPEEQNTDTRSELMDSGYTLLTVIVNNGYADDIMAAARKAGAPGGTILNARGTGTEEDVKFFGISLVPEKEILMIVAADENVQAVLDSIRGLSCLATPGSGIVYTMNVEEFIVLGQ